MEEICDTPAELLASRDPAGTYFDEACGQSAERERISESNHYYIAKNYSFIFPHCNRSKQIPK